MSLRQLVDGDCGGVNPLMHLGGQFTRDLARKDEGFTQASFEHSMRPEEQMVNEFLGHVAAPPQSFHMEYLLQEMRDINLSTGQQPRHLVNELAGQWTKDFEQHQQQQQQPPALPANMHMHMQAQQQQLMHGQDFFDEPMINRQNYMTVMPRPYLELTAGATAPDTLVQMQQNDAFFDDDIISSEKMKNNSVEDWINAFQNNKDKREQTAANLNEKFWQRLQDEWQKLSEDNEHPWLSEYNENLDAYKEYEFAEENPMSDIENAFEKGKEYLAKGDVPSAVLCFEIAAKKEPEKAAIWELLGKTQAENEMDPQAISALKRALDLQPNNGHVLMSLAVCYTNEGLQNSAVKMLTNWLQINPKYCHLIEQHPELQTSDVALASSLVGGNRLQILQDVYLDAVRLQPNEVDANVQEALGVLYNLSGEYDKAVDCFRAAVSVESQNAKIWNRLGASLANGSRSVEAIEAYQRALELQPGFIRVRYNVGVCCMNLKAYKEAVEHLLTALTMQANTSAHRDLPNAAAATIGQIKMSESIWSTLRMVISLMGRSDLQGYVNERNLTALNEAFSD